VSDKKEARTKMKFLLPLTFILPYAHGACTCTDDVVKALSQLYVSTGGANWDDKKNWMDFDEDPCDGNWDGLTASSDVIVKMDIENNNLAGCIPTQFGLLTDLTNIKIGKNDLTGTIPSEVGMLSNVEKFKMQENSISGSIPSWFGLMTNVASGNNDFNLEDNLLCGDIPDEVSALSGGNKFKVSDGNGLGTPCDGTDDGTATTDDGSTDDGSSSGTDTSGDDSTDSSGTGSDSSGDDSASDTGTDTSSGTGSDSSGDDSASDTGTDTSSGTGSDSSGDDSASDTGTDTSSGTGSDSSSGSSSSTDDSCVDTYSACATYVEAGKCSTYFCTTCSYSGYCDSSCGYCAESDDASSGSSSDSSGSSDSTDDAGSSNDDTDDSASTGSSGAGGRTCFSGDDKVQLESGDMKLFRSVQVGDSILSANRDGVTSYSNVVFLPHGENDKRANFVEIHTEGGKTIKMTHAHLLPLCSGALSLAVEIEAGSCVRTIDGDDNVVNVSKIELNGVYTAVTENEFLVVNGIIASPFASSSGLVHAFYNMTDMEDWCESNDWLAFESARHPHVQQMVKPSEDCLSMLNEMFENFKDEPVGWGAEGFGYRGNWQNPASPEITSKAEKSVPFVLSGWD